VRKSKSVGGES